MGFNSAFKGLIILAKGRREWRCWLLQRFPANREPVVAVQLPWHMATAHRQFLPMKAHVSVEVYSTFSCTLAPDECEWAASVPFRFTLQRVSRPQCWSVRFGEETLTVLSRIEPLLPSCTSRSLVTMVTKLRMSYRGSGTRFAELHCKKCKYFDSRGAAPRSEPTSRLHGISTVIPCCKVRNVILLFAGQCSTRLWSGELRLDLRKGQKNQSIAQHNIIPCKKIQ